MCVEAVIFSYRRCLAGDAILFRSNLDWLKLNLLILKVTEILEKLNAKINITDELRTNLSIDTIFN